MEYQILRNYWGKTKKEVLNFPSNWSVEPCLMGGYNLSPLRPLDIKYSILNPIGTSNLKKMAKGKKNAVIIFDDISRPTRINKIAPFIIKELTEGGLEAKDISFICALGAHGAHGAQEFRKKLGNKIIGKYKVYNHNPFINCDHLGKTSLGTDVEINRELMEADLKIGIGSMLPHPIVGFSGGGKVYFPGVASIESIKQNHHAITKHVSSEVVFWQEKNNIFKCDIDEAVSFMNIDFTINALVNGQGQIIALFSGNYKIYNDLAVKKAKKIYHTKQIEKKRVVILNAFLKSNEAFSAILLGTINLRKKGGVIILITDSPPGQVVHYLTGSFGRHNKGPLNFKQKAPQNLLKIIIVSPYIFRADEDWFVEPAEGIVWVNKFPLAIKEAEKTFSGGNIDAALFPNATIQYYPDVKVSL